jgi:hypothetical protein
MIILCLLCNPVFGFPGFQNQQLQLLFSNLGVQLFVYMDDVVQL